MATGYANLNGVKTADLLGESPLPSVSSDKQIASALKKLASFYPGSHKRVLSARSKRVRTNAGFASSQESRRKTAYRLQSLAARLLPNEKVSQCHKLIVPEQNTVQVRFHKGSKKARYKNLVCCERHNICKVCADKKAEHDRKLMLFALAYSGYKTAMFTFTLRHTRDDDLLKVYTVLKKAMRNLKVGDKWKNIKEQYKIEGAIRGREFTHSFNNGWHPHVHELTLFDPSVTDADLKRLLKRIRKIYIKELRKLGFDASWARGVHLTTNKSDLYEYVTKYGREPVDGSGWHIERELTGGADKMARRHGRTQWQLLHDYGEGDTFAGALFIEYQEATKNDHPVRFSPGLKDKLGIQGGKEIDSELMEIYESDEIELAELSREQWQHVKNRGLRAELLDVAANGDQGELWTWLHQKDIPCVVKWSVETMKPVPRFEGYGTRIESG